MLSVENLIVQFDQRAVLQDLSFTVKEGEIIGLIGQNGCGKTTLLNTLSGFAPSTSGSIIFQDKDITRLQPYQRAALGLGRSFQHAGVFKEMTVAENLMIALEHVQKYPWWWRLSANYRKKGDKIIENILAEVGLQGHKDSLAGVLSGGQLRLLELLRLKISGGSLLLIDEPTAGVSPAMKKVLTKAIKELAKDKNRSMIIVEHDLKFLFELVDRVIVLVEGAVYLEGKPEEVVKDKRLQEVYLGVQD